MSHDLPEFCLVKNAMSGRIVRINRGEGGFVPLNLPKDFDWIAFNQERNISPAQAFAMITGSMLGWNAPGANPAWYANQNITWDQCLY